MEGKIELRNVVRQRLRGLTEASLVAKSRAICARIIDQPEWHKALVIGLFAPQPHEPNVDPLAMEQPRGDAKQLFCYPKVSSGELHFYHAPGVDALIMGRWQIREPAGRPDDRVESGRIDLLLVPGVAFTREGCRLGRGGGFYDRLLATPGFRATTFGICFEEQLTDHIPVEAHDLRVDRVISA